MTATTATAADRRPINRSAHYERNDGRYDHRNGRQCEICGKAVRNDLWLAVDHETFEAVAVEYAIVDDEACSFYAIGARCARQFPGTHLATTAQLNGE